METDIPEGTRLIPLTRGKVAIVDAADFDFLNRFRWSAWKPSPGKGNSWYAVTGRQGQRGMHQILMNTSRGEEVDHKNGNGLDNRRSNLRRATRTQNVMNQGKVPYWRGRPTAGRFKGVRFERGRYIAVIRLRLDGENRPSRKKWLGGFRDDEEAAARAYDAAARKYFGEFAWLNFPDK